MGYGFRMDILFNTPADSLEVGDQIIIDDDMIEIREIQATDDLDEVLVKGYSYITGDSEQYSLFADDHFDVWAV